MKLLEESIYTNYLIKFMPKEKRERVDITDKVKQDFISYIKTSKMILH